MVSRSFQLRALGALMTIIAGAATGQTTNSMTIPPLPTLSGFQPLPAADRAFSKQIGDLVRQAKLDERTPAGKNPDGEEEWASICIVDLGSPQGARVGGWEMDNFVYPASAYKMYVLGEAVRQVCAGERQLDDVTTVAEHNFRADSALSAGQRLPLSEVLRLMCMYSDNTAANIAIDIVDRRRASALLHALGCMGSEITRKFLPRDREDPDFVKAPGTVSSAHHFATFLWAVEQGAIGGGKGRGLIKGYLATNVQNATRVRAGVPTSATVYSKTGEWNTFTSEAALVEDGQTRYIICLLTALPQRVAAPRMAAFTRSVHELLSTKK